MPGNFDNFFINKNLTIKNAMRQLDKVAKKILFVTDKERRLKGTVTDGDIRRWILADGDLNERVDKIYNSKPLYIKRQAKDISKGKVRKILLEAGVEPIPAVDEDMKIIDIFFWKDIFKEDDTKEKKQVDLKIPVVIMAGGQGSRLDPFTRILPKALIPIGDRPAVEVIINNFLEYISGDIYLILGYKGEMVKSYFDNNNSINRKIIYIDDGKKMLGTAGGLRAIPKSFPDTFFLSNCDTIIKAGYDDIYAFHMEKGNDITIVGSMQHFVVPYGVMRIQAGGKLKKIEEKPEYDFLVNTGMYVIEKRILRYIPRDKMFHIPDLINAVKAKKRRIGVYPVSEKSWHDVGQWESYKETTKALFSDL